ncbi:MAG: IS66 family insertion sequence element accessory protein TnpB [Lachnospiraceae bacterium]|nr:IS66 family insertion sequence element accessory protein TnpB [Lachnospiraceae bacterium]
MFPFNDKHTNKIKGLVWEVDGFLFFTKWVKDGHFSWPHNSNKARFLSSKQLK